MFTFLPLRLCMLTPCLNSEKQTLLVTSFFLLALTPRGVYHLYPHLPSTEGNMSSWEEHLHFQMAFFLSDKIFVVSITFSTRHFFQVHAFLNSKISFPF